MSHNVQKIVDIKVYKIMVSTTICQKTVLVLTLLCRSQLVSVSTPLISMVSVSKLRLWNFWSKGRRPKKNGKKSDIVTLACYRWDICNIGYIYGLYMNKIYPIISLIWFRNGFSKVQRGCNNIKIVYISNFFPNSKKSKLS